MPRFFYDSEFLDTGTTIELISIGIVAEDGREYYGVNSEMPEKEISNNRWLCENVVPHLPLSGRDKVVHRHDSGSYYWSLDMKSTLVKPKWVIANEVREFILTPQPYPQSGLVLPEDFPTELWAYYSAYDHVVLAQLWGRMIDPPKGIPMWTHDLMQLWETAGRPDKPKESEDQHNALADARWNRDLYRTCMRVTETKHN